MKKEIPDDLIIKNLAGESTPEEDRMLWEWIEGDEENQNVFNESIRLYGRQSDLISKSEIEERLGAMNLRTMRPVTIGWKIAASLLLLCVFFSAIILLDDRVVEQTSFGEIKSISLPDQSIVWLNGATRVSYRKNSFVTTRRISVEGEVYVEVSAGTRFVIEYDSIEASLDWGEVNIQTYRHEMEKTAVVNNGIVTFRDLRKASMWIIASTDHEVLSRSDYGLLARSINSNVNFRSWVTGIYVFNDEPISRVISVLGNGNPDIKMDLNDTDRDRLISGVFQVDRKRQSSEEILRLLDSQTTLWK